MFFFRSVLSLYLVVVGYLLPAAETWQGESSDESLWSMWLGVVFLEGFAVPLSQGSGSPESLQTMLVRCGYLTVVVFDLLAARSAISWLAHKLRAATARFLESRLLFTQQQASSTSPTRSARSEPRWCSKCKHGVPNVVR